MASVTRQTLRRRLLELMGDPAILPIAGSGSTTTFVDASGDTPLAAVDDFYNGHYIYISKDAGGSNAAPENEIAIIKDYTGSTQTITLDHPLTAAVASGDEGDITKRFSSKLVNEALNQAILKTGEKVRLEAVDTVTLGANDYDYALSFMSIDTFVQRVEMEDIDTPSSYPYVLLAGKDYEVRNDEGTYTLQLFFDPGRTRTCRIIHYKLQSTFTLDTSTTTLPQEILLAGARAEIYYGLAAQQGSADGFRMYYTLAQSWEGTFERLLARRHEQPKARPAITMDYSIPGLLKEGDTGFPPESGDEG